MYFDLSILSNRERQILQLVATGMHHYKAAERLFISHKTVSCHLDRIKGKLEVHDLVAWWRLLLQVHDDVRGRDAVVGDI